MYKIVSSRYESVIKKNFARLRRANFFLAPPNHKSVPTALLPDNCLSVLIKTIILITSFTKSCLYEDLISGIFRPLTAHYQNTLVNQRKQFVLFV